MEWRALRNKRNITEGMIETLGIYKGNWKSTKMRNPF